MEHAFVALHGLGPGVQSRAGQRMGRGINDGNIGRTFGELGLMSGLKRCARVEVIGFALSSLCFFRLLFRY